MKKHTHYCPSAQQNRTKQVHLSAATALASECPTAHKGHSRQRQQQREGQGLHGQVPYTHCKRSGVSAE